MKNFTSCSAKKTKQNKNQKNMTSNQKEATSKTLNKCISKCGKVFKIALMKESTDYFIQSKNFFIFCSQTHRQYF